MIASEMLDAIENPDNYLVEEARKGDMHAEEILIRKYSSIVRNKGRAYYMAGADGDDVLQEGMIGLLRAIRNYDPSKNASFSTFAEICVTRQIIDAIRSADRVKHKPLNTSVSLNIPAGEQKNDGSETVTLGDTIKSSPADSPESILLIKDVTHYILSNNEKVFSDFEMRVINEYIRGYSKEQIAEKMGKPIKSIENAMQRARKKVNEYLWK